MFAFYISHFIFPCGLSFKRKRKGKHAHVQQNVPSVLISRSSVMTEELAQESVKSVFKGPVGAVKGPILFKVKSIY